MIPTSPHIPFVKLQSIGNDFPLIHLEDAKAIFTDSGTRELDEARFTALLGELAISMCDRRRGIGGDGILAVGLEDDAVRLRMFNPDGTEDFCGNGIRCAALHVHQTGWVGSEFLVRHLDREIPIQIEGRVIRTTIGTADYTPEKVPHRAWGELFRSTVWSGIDGGQPMSLFGSALSTGSTHVVILTDHLPDEESFLSVSPKIEVDPLFPIRTSVIWAEETAEDSLRLLIWERGVGETFGCGTGATAAAADYMRRKGRGGTVSVTSKGGTLRVSASSWDSILTLEGQAEIVYRGRFPLQTHNRV